jgi:hypothetical protein
MVRNSPSGSSAKKRGGKVRHAHSILGHMASLQKVGDVTMRCSDGNATTHTLLLAAISPMLREYLAFIEASAEAPMVVVPQLSVQEVQTLFDYIFARDRYRPDEFPRLRRACRELGVPADLLPEVINRQDDVSDYIDEDDGPPREVVLSGRGSLKITPVSVGKVTGDDADEDDLEGDLEALEKEEEKENKRKGRKRTLSSPSRKPKEKKVVSYSSYGRARRSTARIEDEILPDNDDADANDAADIAASDDGEAEEERPSLLPESHRCNFCSMTYNHVKARNRHMMSDHAEECAENGMHFRCDQCSQVFTSATGRSKHVIRVHNSKEIASREEDNDAPLPDNVVVDPDTGTHRVKCPFEHRDGNVVLVRTLKDFRYVGGFSIVCSFTQPGSD